MRRFVIKKYNDFTIMKLYIEFWFDLFLLMSEFLFSKFSKHKENGEIINSIFQIHRNSLHNKTKCVMCERSTDPASSSVGRPHWGQGAVVGASAKTKNKVLPSPHSVKDWQRSKSVYTWTVERIPKNVNAGVRQWNLPEGFPLLSDTTTIAPD